MKRKISIKRVLFVAMWMVIGTGMLTLLIAAIGRQNRNTCKDVEITLHAAENKDLFLDEADITKLLKAATHGKIKGQVKERFDLRQIERLLENNVWVKQAQVWFDNRDVLRVTVTERDPIARIFTPAGQSFYLDETGQVMPLSPKVSVRLPVFTGFPEKHRWNNNDSALVRDIRGMATYISGHPFWQSQVAQVDVRFCGPACWEMDLVPVVGNHVVRFGNAQDLDQKFNRLYTFYKQVLSKTGFDHYQTVDVRFNGQVLGSRTSENKITNN